MVEEVPPPRLQDDAASGALQASCPLCSARTAHAARFAVDEASLSGSKLRSWRELQARWGWLEDLDTVDQSWISFGLFHAYQQAGWALHPKP